VKWLEEPLDPDDWRGHAALAADMETPIALGEHVYTARAFEDFVEARAVAYVQCDATRVGGVTEFLRVAQLAERAGLPVCPHAGDMMQVHQHLVFVAPTAHRFEHIPWGAELWVEPAVVKDGVVRRPTAPGAGIAIRDDMLARYTVGRARAKELA
jgi:L-alanine-DL-glutamate epimerase-like enolase superfamily enzyme